ncbi:hypothetical protein BO99DRAFT_59078 [Aspergillus violaceofuscus CBS 115571]|uniref:Uncharacterized protein n=1 Tax=Aspergillus violaceofuscus (strain CBS 115571) TaxID=1450538 RepID=A0A2V5GW28_ASPV1|nr:hypothetical protein BO99DRAFT_59078 [Aspergillus violaceofuscus CBS 115571]
MSFVVAMVYCTQDASVLDPGPRRGTGKHVLLYVMSFLVIAMCTVLDPSEHSVLAPPHEFSGAYFWSSLSFCMRMFVFRGCAGHSAANSWADEPVLQVESVPGPTQARVEPRRVFRGSGSASS